MEAEPQHVSHAVASCKENIKKHQERIQFDKNRNEYYHEKCTEFRLCLMRERERERGKE